MKHSLEIIRKALEFYVTKGVHGNKVVIPIVLPAIVSRHPGIIAQSRIKAIEFSVTELKLYNSKLGRAMYVS